MEEVSVSSLEHSRTCLRKTDVARDIFKTNQAWGMTHQDGYQASGMETASLSSGWHTGFLKAILPAFLSFVFSARLDMLSF